MPKYEIHWIKSYHASGSVEIESSSQEEAEKIALDNMGDYTGSMQYDPDKNEVYALATLEELAPGFTKKVILK